MAGTLNTLVTILTPLGLALAGWVSTPLGLPWLFRIAGLAVVALALRFMRTPAPETAAPSSATTP